MGITQLSLDRLNRNNCLKANYLMLELGAQNIYANQNYGDVAKYYFQRLGIVHQSIDIIEHQGADKQDLRIDLGYNGGCDCVTNFGTLEHVDGSLYQPLKNIHEACKVGGIMIHENPKTGNWPGHGQHYFTKDFWIELAKACKYELIEVCEEAAMSNTKDGWNVCAVLRVAKDSKFITELQFNKIYNEHIQPK
jgi:hypothetical protein